MGFDINCFFYCSWLVRVEDKDEIGVGFFDMRLLRAITYSIKIFIITIEFTF
jgi:hypothetical protein